MSKSNEPALKIAKEIARLLERNRLVFFIVLLLVISGYFISVYKDSLFKSSAQWMVHSVVVNNKVNQIQSQQNEIGLIVRGYILTPDSDYLTRYESVMTSLWQNTDKLEKLTSDNPEQQNQITLLHRYLHNDAVLTNSLLIIADLPGKKGDSALLRNELLVSDSIRSVCAVMRANENKLLQKRAQIFQAVSQQGSIFSVFRFLLTLAIIILSYSMLTRELNRRKRTEQQLLVYEKDLKQKIDELNRSNEELEQFAFVASHDIQEPIRKITAFSDRLKLKYRDHLDETGKFYIDKIQNAAVRMSNLIRDLLEFSRVSHYTKAEYKTDLNMVMEEIMQALEAPIIQKNAVIEWKNLPVVNADNSQMTRLFENLVANALKFSKQNITPQIKIFSEEVSGAEAGLDEETVYDKISLTDNGIGFDEANSDRIFTIFKRLHGRAEYEGSGIGLGICKRIVSNYKGAIRAYSKINEGSTFIVFLPRQET